MSTLTIRRAIFVYESARLAAMAAEAPMVPETWQNRDNAFLVQFVATIERLCQPGVSLDPEALHADWVEAYAKMGWVYGAVRDAVAKTHPDMVPYGELNKLEKDKDDVFAALCVIARNWIQ